MNYFFKRLLKLVPTLLGLSFLTFCLLYLAPSDPAEMHYHKLGVTPTEETLDKFREEKGLNDPLLIQYKNWLFRVLGGDLGQSYNDGQDVLPKINKAIPYTLSLGVNGVVLSLLISLPLGFYLGAKPRSRLSKGLLSLSFMGNSLPNFIIGLGLIYLFAI